ncbi:MAG: ABC transporter permease [Syntrophomonadaceae bacterium]|nr:ABC transporter permease [Syntrophomonadaceae bacterium]
MKRSGSIAHNLVPAITLLVILAIWEGAVRLSRVPAYIMPGPVQIISTLRANFSLLLNHTGSTMLEALIGFGLAVIIAFLVAFALNQVNWLNQAVMPLLVVTQTIPIITLAPLFLIWFGWGMLPKVLVVILVCFFPVVINLLNGLNSVDPDLVNLFRSMGAGRMDVFRMVKLPSALPAFFAGMKISASYGVMAAVIGEWLGAQQGLGYYMTIAQKSFRVDKVLAAVMIIAGLSLIWVKIIDWMEILVMPWTRHEREWEID